MFELIDGLASSSNLIQDNVVLVSVTVISSFNSLKSIMTAGLSFNVNVD